jgi:hypothetical protein
MSGQKEKSHARKGVARSMSTRDTPYHRTENPRVGGSTPSPGTMISKGLLDTGEVVPWQLKGGSV